MRIKADSALEFIFIELDYQAYENQVFLDFSESCIPTSNENQRKCMIELSGGINGGVISGAIIAIVNYFASRHKNRLDKAEKIIIQLCN